MFFEWVVPVVWTAFLALSLLFLKKKKQKDFIRFFKGVVPVERPTIKQIKVFLVLFLQKKNKNAWGKVRRSPSAFSSFSEEKEAKRLFQFFKGPVPVERSVIKQIKVFLVLFLQKKNKNAGGKVKRLKQPAAKRIKSLFASFSSEKEEEKSPQGDAG